jgi:hypothetical protein
MPCQFERMAQGGAARLPNKQQFMAVHYGAFACCRVGHEGRRDSNHKDRMTRSHTMPSTSFP